MRMQLLQFGGMIPRLSETLLDGAHAAYARDCNLTSGRLVPFETNLTVTTLPDANRLSIFQYRGSWLSWPYDVDVVRNPVAEDQYERIYFTGTGRPQVIGFDGTQQQYDLGIPAPDATPTTATAAKSATEWYRDWQYFYEEPDGSQVDNGHLTEGTATGNVREVVVGSIYRLPAAEAPAKVTASGSAILVLFFDAYSSTGRILGRVYPDISASEGNSDLFISGAKISLQQATVGGQILVGVAYDTSTAEDWTTSRSYVYTYKSAWGEEGPPSSPSTVLDVLPNQNVAITGMSTGPTDMTTNITLKRIYRTVTGNGGTAYQFVAEIPVGQADYTDVYDDTELGAVISTDQYYPPPEDLVGIVVHPAGFLCGFSASDPRTLWVSAANLPFAWPPGYAVTIDDEIVGLGVAGHTIVVMTKGRPYAMTGDDPASLVPDVIPFQQPCVAKRGIVSANGAVLYPSNEGLCAIDSAGNGRVISEAFYTTPEWQEIGPAGMIGAFHDDRYIGIGTEKTIVYGIGGENPPLVESAQQANGVLKGLTETGLYIIDGADVVLWRAGTERRTAIYRSAKRQFGRIVEFMAARITAEDYEDPPTLRILTEYGTVFERQITSNTAFKLPILRRAKFWQVEVETTTPVIEVLLTTSMQEVG